MFRCKILQQSIKHAGLALICTALTAGAAVVSTDFEASLTLALPSGSYAAETATVSVSVVTTNPLAPTFSGKVIRGGVSQSIQGVFKPVTDKTGEFSAVITNLKGLRNVTLGFSFTENNEAGGLTVGIPEYQTNPQMAFRAWVPPAGPDRKPWILKQNELAVLQFRTGAFADLEALVSAANNPPGEYEATLQYLEAQKKIATDNWGEAQAQLSAAQAQLGQAKALNWKTRYAARKNAESNLSKAKADSALVLSRALYAAGLSPSSCLSLAGSYVSGVESFTQSALSSPSAKEMIDGEIRAVTALAGLLTLRAFDAAVSLLSNPVPRPETESLVLCKTVAAACKKVWLPVSAATKELWTARMNFDAEDVLLDRVDPQLLATVYASQTKVDEAQQVLTNAIQYLASATSALEAEQAYQQKRVAFTASSATARSLAGFKGYGNFLCSVGNATGTAPLSALVVGVTPDGQKFTQSTKFRIWNEDAPEGVMGGHFVLNALSGTNPVNMRIPYRVDLNAFFARILGTGESDAEAKWSGVSLSFRAGTPPPRSPVSNIFGSEVTTRLIVDFGKTSRSSSAVEGFGTSLSAQNVVGKLVAAKSGSSLRVTSTPVPGFLGAYALSGGAAAPFDGIFLNEGTEIRGYGRLASGKTSSETVDIYVATDSPSTETPPSVPSIPPGVRIVWPGIKGSAISFTLGDMPAGLGLTTVRMLDGNRIVASAPASANGTVIFPSKDLNTGSAYRLQAVREIASGTLESVASGSFELAARTLPAYTYQMLLGPQSGALARDGNRYQGRLSFTTTPSGAWTGKLEWLALHQARNEKGELSSYTFGAGKSVWIPTLASYSIMGQLLPSGDAENPGRLSSKITIPVNGGAAGHTLTIDVSDLQAAQLRAGGALEKPFGALPSAPFAALNASSVLELDPSFGEPGAFVGSALAASAGVLEAKGKYSSITVQDEEPLNNQSHTFDYQGTSALLYTFQTGANAGRLSCACKIGLDGVAPILSIGRLESFSLPYTTVSNRTATAPMEIVGAMANPVKVGSVSGATQKFEIRESYWTVGGYILEIASQFPGGHVLRESWRNDPEAIFEIGLPWGLAHTWTIPRSKRYADFDASEKVVAGKSYQFEIVLSDVNMSWSDMVTFNAEGIASFSKAADAKGRGITLRMAPGTGTFTATVKLSDGAFSPLGRTITRTGFSLPGVSLLGWGGIEGGDVGFRIRSAQ